MVSLKAPALRERPEDTLPLAEHFAKKYAAECGRKIVGLAPEARAYLQSYSWPGNVRELENAIERAVVLGSADMLLAEDLPEHIRESRPAAVSASMYEEAVEAAKRQVVLQAFEQVNHDHEAGGEDSGPASQLPAQADPDHEFEACVEARAQVPVATEARP